MVEHKEENIWGICNSEERHLVRRWPPTLRLSSQEARLHQETCSGLRPRTAHGDFVAPFSGQSPEVKSSAPGALLRLPLKLPLRMVLARFAISISAQGCTAFSWVLYFFETSFLKLICCLFSCGGLSAANVHRSISIHVGCWTVLSFSV